MIGALEYYLLPDLHPYLVTIYQSWKGLLNVIWFLVCFDSRLPLTDMDRECWFKLDGIQLLVDQVNGSTHYSIAIVSSLIGDIRI